MIFVLRLIKKKLLQITQRSVCYFSRLDQSIWHSNQDRILKNPRICISRGRSSSDPVSTRLACFDFNWINLLFIFRETQNQKFLSPFYSILYLKNIYISLHCCYESRIANIFFYWLKTFLAFNFNYIFSHPQTDCFVVSQLFNMARPAIGQSAGAVEYIDCFYAVR